MGRTLAVTTILRRDIWGSGYTLPHWEPARLTRPLNLKSFARKRLGKGSFFGRGTYPTKTCGGPGRRCRWIQRADGSRRGRYTCHAQVAPHGTHRSEDRPTWW